MGVAGPKSRNNYFPFFFLYVPGPAARAPCRKFVPNKGPSGGKGQNCTDLDKTFPQDYSNRQCMGLKQVKTPPHHAIFD